MIKSINYNWYFTPENGTAYSNRTVGAIYNKITCTEIKTHYPQGEGDKFYAEIHYDNGNIETIFNPNQIFFEQDKDEN